MADGSSPPEMAQEAVAQAGEKAQEAAGQAQGMMREQIEQRTSEAGERVSGTAQDLRSVGEELRKQGKETPAKLTDRGAEQVERVGSYLSESDADKLLGDVEDFGRRQPLAVLAGGLVVGMAAARFLKASSRSRYQSRGRPEGTTPELGAAQPPPPPPASDVPAEPVGVPVGTPEAPGTGRPGQPVMGR